MEDLNPSYLLGDVGIHAVVGLPWVLGGVDVETSTSAKIPALIFAFDVAATLGGMTDGWPVTKALKMLKPHHSLHRDFTEQNQDFKTNRGNQHKVHSCWGAYYQMVNLRGLVSGATMMMPCSAAPSWLPALVMKFCSVHVRPAERQWKLMSRSHRCSEQAW